MFRLTRQPRFLQHIQPGEVASTTSYRWAFTALQKQGANYSKPNGLPQVLFVLDVECQQKPTASLMHADVEAETAHAVLMARLTPGFWPPQAIRKTMSTYNDVVLVLAPDPSGAVKRETRRSLIARVNVCCPRNGKQVPHRFTRQPSSHTTVRKHGKVGRSHLPARIPAKKVEAHRLAEALLFNLANGDVGWLSTEEKPS